MATYAIGDVQGCYPELSRLLDSINFDPTADRLWFCGDLVNRGGESLQTLRLIHSLRENCVITLGNHDLSLLAVAERPEQAQARVNPDLRKVLFAEDRRLLLDWLRKQKLLHHDPASGYTLVHAGLAPQWGLKQAQRSANEVERELLGPRYRRLMKYLFGNVPPAWHPRLRGLDRIRASINVFTRMRYCDVHGRIDFDSKGRPGTQPAGRYPWYEVPGMVRRQTRIICGHWSGLGLFRGLNIYAIDTGCVWGGQLTALRLDQPEPQVFSVPAESNRRRRPGDDD